jgi:glycosyltransferase involved in cell wall biosynthesis
VGYFRGPYESTLAILVLNEIEAIRQVLPTIQRDWVDEIIVVDGGSTDGTVEYCESQGLKVLRQRQRGYGRGMIELIDIAQARSSSSSWGTVTARSRRFLS